MWILCQFGHPFVEFRGKAKGGINQSWGRSELTDRNVELYPQFFLELITTQLRFYMVSPQLSLLIILTKQSYKFYLITNIVTFP